MIIQRPRSTVKAQDEVLALRTRIITVVSGRTRRATPLTLHNEGCAAFRVWSAQRPESVVLNSCLNISLTEFYHNTGKYSSSDRIRATYTALHIFFISPAFRLGSSLASRVTVHLIQQVNVLKDAVRFRLYSHTVAQSLRSHTTRRLSSIVLPKTGFPRKASPDPTSRRF